MTANPQGPVRVVPDPEVIWLEPACCADPAHGRMWATDNPFPECDDGVQPAKYIRADLAAAPSPAAPIRGVTITEEAYDLVSGYLYACRDVGEFRPHGCDTEPSEIIEMLESNPPGLTAAPEGVEGWLLLHDAPLDTQGLVWSPEAADRTDCFGTVKAFQDGGRFVTSQWLGYEFTHWRPLPAPPVPLADGGR